MALPEHEARPDPRGAIAAAAPREDAPAAPKRSFLDAFRDPRVAVVMLGLGFASGLPNPLTGSTLSAWLATEGVSLEMIGFASLFLLPYNLKFLWAPLVDRFHLPFSSRRRGYLLLTQLALVGCIGLLGSLDPRSQLAQIGLVAVLTAFMSATQDIASDAYKADLLPASQRASGAALVVASYRGAMIAATAGALILAGFLPWSTVYWILAGLMGVGILTTLFLAPAEPEAPPPRSLRETVVEPMAELLRRRGSLALIGVVLFYKFGDAVAGQFVNPFLVSLGFTLPEIGAVNKGFGLVATIVGALLGGGLVARWGLKRSLIVFGLAQTLANLSYAWLAVTGRDLAVMTLAIGVDNFLNGLGTAAFTALLMTLCHRRFSATQYAIFSSLMSLPARVLGMAWGSVAGTFGWPSFFALSVLAGLPAIVLLLRVQIRDPNEPEPA